MKHPSWLDRIRAVLVRFGLSYLTVDHPEMIWRRKGQFLILLQTMLMLTAWLNFGSYIFKDFNSFFPTMQANLVYWMVTLTQLALLIVPIGLAQRGKVRAAAHLLLLTQTVGLVKYALARDFHDYNVLMMASLFLMIPLAGTLLRPRAAFFMSVILCGLEWGLTRAFDPTLNPMILPSFIWMNLNFGAIMTIILVIYEMTLKDTGIGERVRAQAESDANYEDLEWIGWSVAHVAYEKVRQPMEQLRGRIVDFDQKQSAILNHDARTELDGIQATMQRLIKELACVLEVYPSGVLAVELQRFDVNASWVLDRMENDIAGADATRVLVHHEPTSPQRVYVAPVALRRAIEEIIQVMIAVTGTQEVTIIDGATDDFWLIRIRSGTALPYDPAKRLRPTDPALRHAAARIQAMLGTLAVDATPGAPLIMTLSFPLSAQA